MAERYRNSEQLNPYGFDIGYYSVAGTDKEGNRQLNCDNQFVNPHIPAFGTFDAPRHGPSQRDAAEIASDTFEHHLEELFQSVRKPSILQTRNGLTIAWYATMTRYREYVNHPPQFREQYVESIKADGMNLASTAAAVVLVQEAGILRAIGLHGGDSKVLLGNQDESREQTENHSYVYGMKEEFEITKNQAEAFEKIRYTVSEDDPRKKKYYVLPNGAFLTIESEKQLERYKQEFERSEVVDGKLRHYTVLPVGKFISPQQYLYVCMKDNRWPTKYTRQSTVPCRFDFDASNAVFVASFTDGVDELPQDYFMRRIYTAIERGIPAQKVAYELCMEANEISHDDATLVLAMRQLT